MDCTLWILLWETFYNPPFHSFDIPNFCARLLDNCCPYIPRLPGCDSHDCRSFGIVFFDFHIYNFATVSISVRSLRVVCHVSPLMSVMNYIHNFTAGQRVVNKFHKYFYIERCREVGQGSCEKRRHLGKRYT